MRPAVALFQICHRLNASRLTLFYETSGAHALPATICLQCGYHPLAAEVAIASAATPADPLWLTDH
jgi:hypothetical protein